VESEAQQLPVEDPEKTKKKEEKGERTGKTEGCTKSRSCETSVLVQMVCLVGEIGYFVADSSSSKPPFVIVG